MPGVPLMRPAEAHDDWFVVPSVVCIEFADTVLVKMSHLRRYTDATFRRGPIQAPLMCFLVVESQCKRLAARGSIERAFVGISFPIPEGPYDIAPIEFGPIIRREWPAAETRFALQNFIVRFPHADQEIKIMPAVARRCLCLYHLKQRTR